jgi:transposase
MEGDRSVTTTAQTPQISQSWLKTYGPSAGPYGDLVCITKRDPLGNVPARTGLRFGDELLAISARLEETRGLAEDPQGASDTASGSRQDRFLASGGRQLLCESRVGGAKTGPNPTDRRKKGTKHHIITEAQGIPLAVRVTEANRHDVTQLLALVEAIPPIRGKMDRPLRKPAMVQGDCGYDSEPHRRELRERSIVPLIRRRGTAHGSGLGQYRWFVERTLLWLHQFRRLHVRFEKRDDIHEALVMLGCIMICWSALVSWSPLS